MCRSDWGMSPGAYGVPWQYRILEYATWARTIMHMGGYGTQCQARMASHSRRGLAPARLEQTRLHLPSYSLHQFAMLPIDKVAVNTACSSTSAVRATGDIDSARLNFYCAYELCSQRLMRTRHTGELYALSSTREADIGERTGVGAELFLRSYRMYAVFFAVLTVVSLYPVIDNSQGDKLQRTKSYWILRFCMWTPNLNPDDTNPNHRYCLGNENLTAEVFPGLQV